MQWFLLSFLLFEVNGKWENTNGVCVHVYTELDKINSGRTMQVPEGYNYTVDVIQAWDSNTETLSLVTIKMHSQKAGQGM